MDSVKTSRHNDGLPHSQSKSGKKASLSYSSSSSILRSCSAINRLETRLESRVARLSVLALADVRRPTEQRHLGMRSSPLGFRSEDRRWFISFDSYLQLSVGS